MPSGQVVVLGILGVALSATGYAWLHHRGQGQHSLDFWGSENALLVRRAQSVRVDRLEHVPLDEQTKEPSPTRTKGDVLEIDSEKYVVTASRDISEAKGLIHCRQALIFDPTYDWDQSPTRQGEWQYALRFANNNKELVVLFDIQSGLVRHSQPAKVAVAKMPERFESFFEEKLALPETSRGE